MAKCRACGQAYCRECVVEHGGRLMCGECLRRESAAAEGTARSWWRRAPLAASLQWLMAAVVLWWLFYGVAGVLRRIPAAVHEGVVWLP